MYWRVIKFDECAEELLEEWSDGSEDSRHSASVSEAEPSSVAIFSSNHCRNRTREVWSWWRLGSLRIGGRSFSFRSGVLIGCYIFVGIIVKSDEISMKSMTPGFPCCITSFWNWTMATMISSREASGVWNGSDYGDNLKRCSIVSQAHGLGQMRGLFTTYAAKWAARSAVWREICSSCFANDWLAQPQLWNKAPKPSATFWVRRSMRKVKRR